MAAKDARILKSKEGGEHNPAYSTKTKPSKQAEQKFVLFEHSLQEDSQT